jgi:BirA family biotin operon repressor/biotin-[acetyl-CoA-carboxylase] ligase
MINKKKLGGILTEVNMEMDEIEYIVVGLGLNVNISDKDFPDDIKGKAASILTETGKKYPRIDLIKNYLEKFEKYYETLQSGDFRIVMERWKKFENVTGRKVAVDMVNKRYTGKALYVDENGTLIIKDDKGKTHGIFSGSLSFLD